MLTVIVCFVWSGKRRTWSPLSRAYSVIPSTEVTRAGWPPGLAGAAGGAEAFPAGFDWGMGAAPADTAAAKRTARTIARDFIFPPGQRSGAPRVQRASADLITRSAAKTSRWRRPPPGGSERNAECHG